MRKKSRPQPARDQDDFPPLSAKELADLKRQVSDLRDPTRYVIVSAFSRRFCLYYCPESGNYIMNEIPEAAMFKRKPEALAVAKVLERGRKRRMRKSLQVIAVRKTANGVRILEEVEDPWQKGKRWKPSLRRESPRRRKRSSNRHKNRSRVVES
jgi:hypothetical protein